MTFGEFARNYLNPFFMIWRMVLFIIGLALLSPFFDAKDRSIIALVMAAGGAFLVWTAVRPWKGRGHSINDIKKKYDDTVNR
jgi:hypothetical protein